MITEASIKAAMKAAPFNGKEKTELKDAGMRGEGRLTLVIRIQANHVSAEWYAVWYRGERRKSAKIGGYPLMSIADARKTFREEYSPAISRGGDPDGVRARSAKAAAREPTVNELFVAYVKHLKDTGKTYQGAEKYLLNLGDPSRPATGRWSGRKTKSAAKAIGPTRPAAEVTHLDIKPFLAEIYQRGAPSAAAHARSYLSAAFTFAMKSANSYHRAAGEVDWGVTMNPVTAIPFDPEGTKVGSRHLSPAEYRLFWHWLEAARADYSTACAVQIMMLTGQRISEILGIVTHAEAAEALENGGQRSGVFDPTEKVLDWRATKNGMPHYLPICDLASGILQALPANRHGIYFASGRDPRQRATFGAMEYLVTQFIDKHPEVPHFTPRDIRRTWKTLSGAAGLAKDIRDRLQNHAKSDVSSRHYDRYEYLLEKRAAVKIWGTYAERILAGDLEAPVVVVRSRA
jgi:integrase